MFPVVKEIIEKYIHIIEQENIDMLLYLCYRDSYNNFEVYSLRQALADADVFTMEQSKAAAEELFVEAFFEYMTKRKLNYIKSLDEFIYGSPTVKKAFINVFGLEFQDIIDVLKRHPLATLKENTLRNDAEVTIE